MTGLMMEKARTVNRAGDSPQNIVARDEKGRDAGTLKILNKGFPGTSYGNVPAEIRERKVLTKTIDEVK